MYKQVSIRPVGLVKQSIHSYLLNAKVLHYLISIKHDSIKIQFLYVSD